MCLGFWPCALMRCLPAARAADAQLLLELDVCLGILLMRVWGHAQLTTSSGQS